MDTAGQWLLVLMVMTSCVAGVSSGGKEEIQQQLHKATQYPGYDSSLRPLPDPSGRPVLVEIDAVLISVGPVNEMDMTWTVSFYFRQEWTDPRLIVNASDSNFTTASIGFSDVSRLWLPDVYFSNSKEDRKHDVTVPNQLLYVTIKTGRVLYSQRLTAKLNCDMQLQKFPHDSQTCELVIESYSYSTDDLVLKWSSSRSATDFLPTAFMPDFSIVGVDTLDCTTTYAIGTFPCLKATMNMKREIGYYITQNYIPTVLIVVLSWASFWINHEAVPARISVGLLTVLTITTQLSGSRAQLPKVPYIKAIDVWMSTCLVFVFAAYMEYAVVTVLSRRYKKIQNGIKPPSRFRSRSRSASQHSLDSLAELGQGRQGQQNGNLKVRKFAEKWMTKVEERYEAEDDPPSPAKKAPTLPSDIDSRNTGRRVDKSSRFLFPLAFAIFNAVYWVFYMKIA